MENDPAQSNRPPELKPETIYPTTATEHQGAAQPAKSAYSSSPFKRYAGTGIGLLVALAIFAPASYLTQQLAWPIIGLGAFAGVKFFIDAINLSRKMNPIVRSFAILGGLGVGIVIFIACVIGGIVIGFTKDPNPQSTG